MRAASLVMLSLLVVLGILAVDGGAPATSGRPGSYLEARRSFQEAFRAGALDRARTALEAARAAAPGRVDLGYDLACVEARAGRPEQAFAALAPVAGAGIPVDPAADPDLASLHPDPRWAELLARFARSTTSVKAGGPETDVPPELGLVEDLAEDPRTGAVFVSSVRTGEVWRGLQGRWAAWAHPAPRGSGAFALALDPGRRLLHVTVAALPHAEGFEPGMAGRSELVTYRLDDGHEVGRFAAPGEGPHLLGDMALGADGAVLVSDGRAGTVARLRPGARALELLVPPHTFSSPQTPALAAGGRAVYLPDWTLGLFLLPLDGGEPRPVLGPEDLVTGGIDGLATVPGGLIAVQNGIVAPRVTRLWLSEDGTRVTRWAVLARGAGIGEPTHAVRTAGGARVLVDSGWNRFTDEGTLRSGAPPARPRLLRIELH